MNVAALHACFRTLSQVRTSIALHEQAFIKPLNEIEVVLVSVSPEFDCGSPNTLYEELFVERPPPPRLIWTMSSEGWDDAASLIEPFLDQSGRRPSHQYLGVNQSVLISMGEYDEGRFVEP
ncbi:MAG: hypothetical protein H6819_00790 [Phycisphaerales bacterium]|nr:hypothetical protein [Phycisphaerales bacterium]MCB9857256.1 hypothetical protein [Phycisphaerales bacterium]MCB9863030.1 hypothetical protein [Phycisphaerales bacterium]